MANQAFEFAEVKTELSSEGLIELSAIVEMLESCQVSLHVESQFTDAFAWESALRGEKESDLNPVRLAAALRRCENGWKAWPDRGDVMIAYGSACTLRMALWGKTKAS